MCGRVIVLVLLWCPALFAQELPLTRIADLRVMSRAALSEHPAVRIRGVITWIGSMTTRGALTVQDDSGGIWVNFEWARERHVWKGDTAMPDSLREGLEIEMVGVLDPGGFAPVMVPDSVRVLGEKPLPVALPASLSRLMNGADGLLRVELNGVVQSCLPFDNLWRLRVDTGLGYFFVHVPRSEGLNPASLEDAVVRVSGVASTVFNARGEFVRPRLFVTQATDVVIEKDAPADPFSAPKVELAGLAAFAPEGRSVHRCRVEGVVSYFVPGALLYLQGEGCAVRVRTSATGPLRLGDRVEASGFIENDGPVAGLSGALIRRLGSGAGPQPLGIEIAEILNTFNPSQPRQPGKPRDYDGLLISVTGHLLSVRRDLDHGGAWLVVDCAGTVTTANLDGKTDSDGADQLQALRPGSRVRVTGVALVRHEAPQLASDFAKPTRVELLLRGAQDVTMLQAASLWTPQRLGIALAIASVVIVVSLMWIFALRRLVRQRSARLEEVMRTHRDSELEFHAVRQERQRLAADLHDGVQQLIAGAAYRLEAAAVHLEEIPPAVQTEFAAARSALVRAQTSLRESVAGLALVEGESGDFAALISHAARTMEHWPRAAVVVRVEGEPFPLSRHVMGSLLLLMQEAAGNAFKHGQARQVIVVLAYDAEALEMRVEDDGGGFDPAAAPGTGSGHFGLESMRHRMKWLGGSVEIASHPGAATRVRIRLPRGLAQAAESAAPADAIASPPTP